jgi:hypothetical protein
MPCPGPDFCSSDWVIFLLPQFCSKHLASSRVGNEQRPPGPRSRDWSGGGAWKLRKAAAWLHPSLPGAQKDDITQTENSSLDGLLAGKPAPAELKDFLSMLQSSVPLWNQFSFRGFALGTWRWHLAIQSSRRLFLQWRPIPWATGLSTSPHPAKCLFSLPALDAAPFL